MLYGHMMIMDESVCEKWYNNTGINGIITFPKEFFNEIWLKLGDHEYINIAEIKFG